MLQGMREYHDDWITGEIGHCWIAKKTKQLNLIQQTNSGLLAS